MMPAVRRVSLAVSRGNDTGLRAVALPAARGGSMHPGFPDGELGLWAGLGGVTERAVRVWLRDPDGAPHVAALDVDGDICARVTLRPAPETDYTAAADLMLDRPRP